MSRFVLATDANSRLRTPSARLTSFQEYNLKLVFRHILVYKLI